MEREKQNIERQISDSTLLPIPYSEERIRVVRPEEIINGKLRRLKKVRSRIAFQNGLEDCYEHLKKREFEKLTDKNPQAWLSLLAQQKTNLPAFYDRGHDEFREALHQYVVSKDLFDVYLLARLATEGKIEFSETYYDRILRRSE